MKPMIEDFKPGEEVISFYRVLSISEKQAKNKNPYLAIRLGDRSGEIEARAWQTRLQDGMRAGIIIKARGIVEEYRDDLQLKLDLMRPVRLSNLDQGIDADPVDEADLYECSPYDPVEMLAELRQMIEFYIPDDSNIYRLITMEILESCSEELHVAPAAQKVHHAYRGGLLEHIVSLVKLVGGLPNHYEDQYGLRKDLMIAIACLHDIGKVRELKPDGAGYTIEGGLMGHILIGIEMLQKAGEFVKGEQARGIPSEVPDSEINRAVITLTHCIASHHGTLEHGSPVLPMIPEAIAFHWLDQLDSRMNIAWGALKKAKGEEPFTDRNYFLGNACLFRGWPEEERGPELPMEDAHGQ